VRLFESVGHWRENFEGRVVRKVGHRFFGLSTTTEGMCFSFILLVHIESSHLFLIRRIEVLEIADSNLTPVYGIEVHRSKGRHCEGQEI